MAGVCNKWWCDGRIWRLAKNLKMKIDEQVLRLMVLCPVSPVSTQQYPLLNKNHFGKILYQIFSNLVSNSSRGLQSKNTELFLSSLKLCRARAATGLAYLLRKLRSICVWVLNNILKIINTAKKWNPGRNPLAENEVLVRILGFHGPINHLWGSPS